MGRSEVSAVIMTLIMSHVLLPLLVCELQMVLKEIPDRKKEEKTMFDVRYIHSYNARC